MRLSPRKVHIKVLLSFALFMSLAIASAWLWRVIPRHETRAPSSVLYDDEGEEVMVDIPLKDMQKGFDDDRQREDVAFVRRHDHIFSAGRPAAVIYDRREIAGLLGSDNGLRARRVIFHRDAFVRFLNAGAVPFEFFENARVVARFAPSSAYGTNAGLYTGTIEGEPDGRVRIFVVGDKVSGTFETSSRVFRLIEGETGQHYVIEERLQRAAGEAAGPSFR